MAKTLERYEQIQRQWISDIAHELRTPLSIMRGEIEALQDGVRQYTPEILDSLHAEVMNLAKTVGDLHELSLADSGSLHFERKPVLPVQILHNTLEHFHTRFIQHQITVDNHLPSISLDYITGDARRLKQLFTNIIENSIRYGNSPGTLTIWEEQKDGQLILIIEDSGPGVPQQSLDRIFDRLYRVDFARSRSGDGSGLGLSICKMIAESHNSSIRAENVSVGGLRIIVSFPITMDEKSLEDI
jgi:two-component system sensor histidine kinase BaeS